MCVCVEGGGGGGDSHARACVCECACIRVCTCVRACVRGREREGACVVSVTSQYIQKLTRQRNPFCVSVYGQQLERAPHPGRIKCVSHVKPRRPSKSSIPPLFTTTGGLESSGGNLIIPQPAPRLVVNYQSMSRASSSGCYFKRQDQGSLWHRDEASWSPSYSCLRIGFHHRHFIGLVADSRSWVG